MNLAARAGRWSAEHWKRASAIWLAFVVVAVALGQAVGTHKLSDAEQSTGESARAQQMLGNAGFSTPAAESVLVRSDALTVADPAFSSTVGDYTTDGAATKPEHLPV
jgi:RND superfamily putative drug exporter